MKKGIIVLIVIGVIVILGYSCGKSTYNGMLKSEVNVETKWAEVEASYSRRAELYESVVSTLEGSANFEKSTLKEVIEARSNATAVKVNVSDSASLQQYQQAQTQLQGSFSRLLANVEAYPTLKTTDGFMKFQDQIEGTVNRINIARRDYNGAVSEYKVKIKSFPNNIFASLFGYKEKPFYQAPAGEEKNPKIQFNIK